MTTFNGEKYLEAQIESLSQQQDVVVRVWVNDDGSEDSTVAILTKWKDRGLIKGISETPRIGSTRAFLKLLSEHADSDFVAFCDQDDIWESNKLQLQIQICDSSEPTLVFSDRRYIDLNGLKIGESRKLTSPPSLGNALVENVAPANTILLNRAAIDLVNSIKEPEISHYDSWIYLLIAALGDCKYISMCLVNYRIHEGNLVGLRKLSFRRIAQSVSSFVQQADYLFANLEALQNTELKISLEKFLGAISEPRLIRRAQQVYRLQIKRQSKVDQLIFKLGLILYPIVNSKGLLSNPNS